MVLRGFVLASIVVLAACTTPVGYTDQPMSQYDKDTTYNIQPADNGFTVSVYYSRFQWLPESDAVADACRSALTSIAHEYAESAGRQIDQINPQRIKISMGRNEFIGMTTCSVSAPAFYTN